ncbi:hypothetical protein FHS82_000483 [Pseudochelatococcus lubricantis]|uniref:DUF1491 family protein n=1 Tax=Pseudochelatococcus lubricantis TaxID=1538102 RepID=A0ABX0UXS6_9HYPH|nr:DUF1491 family protein [Pseudochelatococcus lubricantis]NIJ56670.1 hypothetical protein [Pseudochelatococcus lubricantis]
MRLKSEIWVSAYLRRCAVEGAFAVLRRRGAAEAGAIFVLVDRLDGTARLFGPAPQSLADEDAGVRLFAPVPLKSGPTPAAAEERLRREIDFDSDLWIVDVEDREGRHFLDLARE